MWKSAIRIGVVWALASGVLACTNPEVVSTIEPTVDPASPDLNTGPEPGPGLTMLPIRAFQQTTFYTCGPAALLTLLRYYDRNGDEMTIADEAKCTMEKGTNPEGMVSWLEGHGFQVIWGENGSLANLRENLERGVPTLVEWIDYGGHWVLVVGYDTRDTETPNDDIIYFADPADGHDDARDGLTSFNAQRFDAMWFDAFLFDRPMFKVFITAEPNDDVEDG